MTSDNPIELGSWVSVFVIENGPMHQLKPEHFDEIDAALGNWVERRIDRLLHLVTLNGGDMIIPASRICSAVLSTPATRELQSRLVAASKAEEGFSE
jgi:hypothetical protein